MSVAPEPGQVVIVFRNRLRPDADGYPDHAARMGALARTLPGYVEHREAQRAGVRDYYE